MAVARKLRLKVRSLAPLMLLTALAISLATFSLALAALSWVDCRSLSQSLQAWEDNSIQQQGDTPKLLESIRPDLPRDPGSPGVRLSFLQGLLESKRLTRIRRERRKASAAKNKQPFAAHFEVLPNNEGGTYIVENDGIIRKWLEKPLQVKNALSYNKTGEFIVLKDGLYYVYSQVHCDDNTTAYLKLEVKVDDAMAFRCVQGLPTTPLYGQQLAVHSCQASGLIRLRKRSRIRIYSIAGVHLKTKSLTYFGLFKL